MYDEFYQNLGFKIVDMHFITFIEHSMYPIIIVFILKLIYKNLNFEYLKTMFALIVFAISTHLLLLTFLDNEITKAENKIILVQELNLPIIEKNKMIKEMEEIVSLAKNKEMHFLGSAIFVITIILLYGILIITLNESVFITLANKKGVGAQLLTF
ncbi:MAG: hypothetical protein PHE60_07390 [Sulfurospirillaceae bacterium]|nr:hypothetical protein [Sulfurospirillaceae bacterium]